MNENRRNRLRQWGAAAAVCAGFAAVGAVTAYLGIRSAPPARRPAPRITLAPLAADREAFLANYAGRLREIDERMQKLEAAARARHADLAPPAPVREARRRPAPAPAAPLPAPAADPAPVRVPAPKSLVPRLAFSARPAARLPAAAAGATASAFIPSGSFIRVRLLNGVEAPTGGQASSNPVPVVMEARAAAILPNAVRSDLARCFITANATGDLSSERALLRLDRLSCVAPSGRILDTRVTGFVAGEDGRTGLRARLVSKSGQAIASAILVGMLSGLGDAVSMASTRETQSSLTGSVTSTTSNPWKRGFGAGADKTLDRIAAYYLKLADKIFPVLEVDSGREADAVFTQPAALASNPAKQP